MTTSGVTNYVLNRNQLIQGALRLLGQLAEGEAPTAQQIIDGQISLNRLVQAWKAQSIHLWKYKEATLFLTEGQRVYQLGNASTDHAVEDYVSTQVSVSALSGALTIDVDSIAGISNLDVTGIQQDDGSMHWTTVNGAPAGSTITLTAALTDDVSIDNYVFAYAPADAVKRPDAITQLRRVQDINNPLITTPVSMLARRDYFDLSDMSSTGKVVQWYLDKRLNQGDLMVWPTPDSDLDRLTYTYQKPFEVFNSSADDPDFPDEWADALTYNLAVRMAPEYGVSTEDKAWLKQEAKEYLDDMLNFDREPASICLQPNITGQPWGD